MKTSEPVEHPHEDVNVATSLLPYRPHLNRTEGDVRRFYADRCGWKMFDTGSLTPAVREFLSEEAVALEGLMASRQLDHLIEIGCGYGRYLRWAMARGYRYDGFDIVDWMVKIGRLRAKVANSQAGGERCRVHLASVVDIDRVLQVAERPLPGRPIILFPFNCFGNLPQIDGTLLALRAVGVDLAISGFTPDAGSTQARTEYYANCGDNGLQSQETRSGTLISSADGLRSYAYSVEFMEGLLKPYGFDLRSASAASPVGVLMHFTARPQAVGTASRELIRARATELGCDQTTDATGLLTLEEMDVVVTDLSPGKARFRAPRALAPGRIVRIAIGDAGSFVGTVVASAAEAAGAWQTELQMPETNLLAAELRAQG